jgi:hypothetical protein
MQMHAVITNAEQVTPEWLTGILHEKGHLSRSHAISVQRVSRSRHTTTWFADISFLEISYSGQAPKSVPTRLFCKISKPDLTLADLLYGKKEVEFYTTIANTMDDPPLACCYDAVYAPDTGRSHVLLDDLSETHFQPRPPLPPPLPDCERVMDCLASFHAHWWEHPRLGADIGQLSNEEDSNAENLGFPHSLHEIEEMFSGFVDFLGDRLSVARRRLYEQVLSAWPFSRLSKRLNERQGITLIHRDAHAWNFLYPCNPEHDRVRIIDWHEWGIGLGANDLTELMVLWWYPERRARMEEPLVRRYHRQLVERGVEDYDWEQCWSDYRLSASRILLYPIWMYAGDRPPTFWWPILERGILAFQDLECIELLE